MKHLFVLCLIVALGSPFVFAQEDTSELDALEEELNFLDGEDVITDSSGFTEESEEVGDLEFKDVNEELEDILGDESLEESFAEQPSENIEENLFDGIEGDQENLVAPMESQDDSFQDIAAPGAIETPSVNDEEMYSDEIYVEEIAEPSPQAPPPVIEEQTLPAIAEAPEMLRPMDEPNLSKERSIFNAYQYIKNYSNVTESWPQATQGRESETYGIQSGDNLWDISLTLFGSPYFWPKIWQINSSITNPHEIRTGDTLVFVEGDLQQAPQLSQGELEGDVEGDVEGAEQVTDYEMTEEEEILAELPELPALEEKRPPLTEIPPSLGAWHTTGNITDDFGADEISKLAKRIPNVIRLSTYLTDEIPDSQGKVVEVEMGSDSANLYQYVYVESDQVNVGDTLLTYKLKPAISSNGKVIGYPIELEGTLKVTEVVATEKNIFKAMVTYLSSPVTKGAMVKKSGYPMKTISETSPVVNVNAEVIGGEFDNNRKLLALGSIVYFSKGADANIQEGTSLQILKNQKKRNAKTHVENNTAIIAKAQIIDVQARRSTGVITSSSDNVMVGDMTGAANVLSYGSAPASGSVFEEGVDEFDEFDNDSGSDFGSESGDELDFFGE